VTRIIILGGTGAFGERLVRGLVATTDFSLTILVRDASRAAALIAALGAGDGAEAVAVDAQALDAPRLRAFGAFALVDCAGPFQGRDYRLAQAAMEAGLHYIDLADGREFVAGIGALDAAARAAGVLVLSGASSTPALSHAVLDRMLAGWRRIDAIEVAIAPGNQAPRGLSVMRAILSYCGQPVRVFCDGGWTTRRGWGMTTRRDIPGLGPRWLSLCETPDLDLIPARHAPRHAALFRAGLELAPLHLGLALLSLPVRLGFPRSLAPLTPLLHRAAEAFAGWGTDRGGMLVEARGLDAEGAPVLARWTLVAEAGSGPAIPTLPALAALRALVAGRLSRRGATACVGVLDYDQIEAEFRPFPITPGFTVTPDPSLFARALGADFARLPAPIRRLHQPEGRVDWQGEADIAAPESGFARLCAWAFGLPRQAGRLPASVAIERFGARERWTRLIGPFRFHSHLREGTRAGEVEERFGPFRFALTLHADAAALRMEARRWWCGPVPMPRWLMPFGIGEERLDEAGRFRFAVEIRLPGAGRVTRYAGWLRQTPVPGPAPAKR